VSDLAWFKSSYSGAEGGDCVEVAAATGVVHVRDSKAVPGPVVRVSREAWADAGVLAVWMLIALLVSAIGVTRMTHFRTLRDLRPSLIG